MLTKAQTLADWRFRGLILTSKEEGDEIYNRRENSTHCEKCGNKYKSRLDRQMDHSHDIHNKYGYFRNILCKSCNQKRCKIHSQNTSGYSGISKITYKKCKQGFTWVFYVHLNRTNKKIKQSTNKEYLIEYAEQWKKDNHYND